MEAEPRFRRATGIPSRTVGDGVILARPGREDFDALTGPAVAVWNLLQDSHTLQELVELLAWAYGAPRVRVERYVRDLMRELIDRGTIEQGQDRDD